MRNIKGLIAFAVAGLWLAGGSALAAMTGGLAYPPAPGEATLSMTLAYSERDLAGGDVADQARSRRFFFKADFGVAPQVDIYALLGLTDLSYREADFEGNLGEAAGLGVRYSPVTFADRTKLVFDMQAEYAASNEGDESVRSQAYHAAAYFAGEFGSTGRAGYFYPFAGVRLSYAEYANEGFRDYHSDNVFGLFGGADLFINPNAYISAEFHLFDENAFYLGLGYRF